MSKKTCLTRAELELTQRIQTHFPRINSNIIDEWNECRKDILVSRLSKAFGEGPFGKNGHPVVKFIGTIVIPARSEEFIARDHYSVNEERNVKIISLSEDFEKNFLGKIENPTEKRIIQYGYLSLWAKNTSIIGFFGEENVVETTLGEMFSLMEIQEGDKNGILMNTGDYRGYLNIFFIRDINNILWAVTCKYHQNGWHLDATTKDYRFEWRGDQGIKVFSGIQVIS